MSNMKNGFSTLNRWWGKKTKGEKGAPSGKLSKSNTNLSLSVSTTNINETSQLEYNRITPLPVVTSNAPFEQTFRITVLLPKDQLYVARLGARVPLSKLLELVCENKLLDADKYEFRNPVDPSQVYSCDLSIGAVGLSEVRLCHKSESYDTFNTDEVIKLHRTAVIRDSLSSSEFSSRYSKHTAKTTSPYSSSNSLNSMDSTGMNYTRTPVSPPPAMPATPQPRMAPPAPPRKKRAAPRPPSQTVIPERSALALNGTTDNSELPALSNGNNNGNDSTKRIEAMSRKDYCMSTPNLSTTALAATAASNGIDCNGNATLNESVNEHQVATANEQDNSQPTTQSQVEQKNARNLCGGSVQNLSSPSATESLHNFPEPSPRKRIMQMKKKSAPAPPPRGSMYLEDNVSLRSVTASTAGTPCSASNSDVEEAPTTPTDTKSTPLIESAQALPQPTTREITTASAVKPLQSSTPVLETHTEDSEPKAPPATPTEPIASAPKPVPRTTTSTTLLNASNAAADINLTAPANHAENSNVSKVMLNRTPTPEPRSLSAELPESDSGLGPAHINDLHNGTALPDDDAMSKQADSGIGEPVPSPLPDSLPSEGSAHECKSTFESSSDDDDMVKIYNFKLGKTLVKPLPEPKTLGELTALTDAQSDSGDNTPATVTHEATPNLPDTASWNFAIPISPPPNFADANFSEQLEAKKAPDTPITPKIKERPVLNFDSLHTETAAATPDVVDRSVPAKEPRVDMQNCEAEISDTFIARPKTPTTPLPSPTTPLNEIVNELNAIINDKGIDTLIRKPNEQLHIESAKPNTLSNFSIAAIAQHPTKLAEQSSRAADDADQLYRKHDNTNKKPHQGAMRADSFHATVTQSTRPTECALAPENGLNSRSASHLSLTKLEQNELNLNRRRSSSELSIGESPTLQSPEVIKTILNSRKNSLENSSSDGETPKSAHELINQFQEQRASHADTKLASVELKPKSRENVEKSEPTSAAVAEAPHNKPKELPKVYRYSGPPSINFSTWSERPKVQVSIKNEGDYIFGGKNADSQSAAVTTAAMEMTRSYRASTPAGTLKLNVPAEEVSVSALASVPASNAPAVAPKPASTTKRMGIPEKEFRVPVTVRPLRDVTIESVTLRNVTPQAPPTAAKPTGVTTVMLNGAAAAPEPVTKRAYAQHSNTSTLPRAGAHRFSMPAQLSVGPALLRSASITQLEAKQTKAPSEPTPAAPFGQNTLRRTGFKEKMLAREAEEQQSAKSAPHTVSKQYNTTTTTITNGNGCVSISTHSTTPTKTLQSAKLELKLQKSSDVLARQPSSVAPAKPPLTSAKPIKQAFSAVTPPPPPPPTPMTISLKNVSLRTPNGSAATTPTGADPRDQMLDAIRNFKRDTLKRGCV